MFGYARMIPQIDWSPFTEDEVLRYCIGQDYEHLPLIQWDDRIRQRTGLPVMGTDPIVPTLERLREFYAANIAWKDLTFDTSRRLLEEYDGA